MGYKRLILNKSRDPSSEDFLFAYKYNYLSKKCFMSILLSTVIFDY